MVEVHHGTHVGIMVEEGHAQQSNEKLEVRSIGSTFTSKHTWIHLRQAPKRLDLVADLIALGKKCIKAVL